MAGEFAAAAGEWRALLRAERALEAAEAFDAALALALALFSRSEVRWGRRNARKRGRKSIFLKRIFHGAGSGRGADQRAACQTSGGAAEC